jgi:hypothetical protein
MFTEQQRKRFAALREREQISTLTEAEQAELEQLIRQVETVEAAYLRPAVERTRQERLQKEAQNVALKTLIRRQERLVRRLERFLALSRAEHEAINTELAHILGVGASR